MKKIMKHMRFRCRENASSESIAHDSITGLKKGLRTSDSFVLVEKKTVLRGQCGSK